MDEHTTGGPAFPRTGLWERELSVSEDGSVTDAGRAVLFEAGMTLRDYFAAAALTGILARQHGEDYGSQSPETDAKHAYVIADCLIERRRPGATIV